MDRTSPRRLVLGHALLAAVWLGNLADGAEPLATLIVSTPNRVNPLVSERNPLPPMESLGTDQHFQVRVGPPEATLSVSVVEPADKTKPPKGTVLVLHGIFARSAAMLRTAHRLSRAGYRAVLVDLRGHGRSTGEYLTYGTQEARDLSQVIDVLVEQRLASGPLGVYGVSYGATTAIHLAGIDARVQAVVAVEPFAVVRDEVSHFGRTMVPGVGLLIPEKTYQQSLDEAGRIGGFDPDESNARDAIRRTSAHVLLVHGTADWVTSHRQSVLLHDAAPDHSDLVSIPCQGHIALWLDPTSNVSGRGCEWFDRWLAHGEHSRCGRDAG